MSGPPTRPAPVPGAIGGGPPRRAAPVPGGFGGSDGPPRKAAPAPPGGFRAASSQGGYGAFDKTGSTADGPPNKPPPLTGAFGAANAKQAYAGGPPKKAAPVPPSGRIIPPQKSAPVPNALSQGLALGTQARSLSLGGSRSSTTSTPAAAPAEAKRRPSKKRMASFSSETPVDRSALPPRKVANNPAIPSAVPGPRFGGAAQESSTLPTLTLGWLCSLLRPLLSNQPQTRPQTLALQEFEVCLFDSSKTHLTMNGEQLASEQPIDSPKNDEPRLAEYMERFGRFWTRSNLQMSFLG